VEHEDFERRFGAIGAGFGGGHGGWEEGEDPAEVGCHGMRCVWFD